MGKGNEQLYVCMATTMYSHSRQEWMLRRLEGRWRVRGPRGGGKGEGGRCGERCCSQSSELGESTSDGALEEELRELFEDEPAPQPQSPEQSSDSFKAADSEQELHEAVTVLEGVWQRMQALGRLAMPSESELEELASGTGVGKAAVEDFFQSRISEKMSAGKGSSTPGSLTIGSKLEKQAADAGFDPEALKREVAAFPLERFEGDWDNPVQVGAWNAAIEGEKEIAQQMLRLFGAGKFESDELDEGDFEDDTADWLKDPAHDLISAHEIRTAIAREGENPDFYGFFDEFDRGSRFKSPQVVPSGDVDETPEYKELWQQARREVEGEEMQEQQQFGHESMSEHKEDVVEPESELDSEKALQGKEHEVTEGTVEERGSEKEEEEEGVRAEYRNQYQYDEKAAAGKASEDAAASIGEGERTFQRSGQEHEPNEYQQRQQTQPYTNFDLSEEDQDNRDVETMVENVPINKVKMDMSLWVTEGGWDALPGMQPSDPPGDGEILRKQNIDPQAQTIDYDYYENEDLEELRFRPSDNPSSDATYWGTANGTRLKMSELNEGDELYGWIHTINLYNGALIDVGAEFDAFVFICEADWSKVYDRVDMRMQVKARIDTLLSPTYRFRFPIEATLLEPDISKELTKTKFDQPPIIKYEGEPHKRAWTEGGREWPPAVEQLDQDPVVVEQMEAREEAMMREQQWDEADVVRDAEVVSSESADDGVAAAAEEEEEAIEEGSIAPIVADEGEDNNIDDEGEFASEGIAESDEDYAADDEGDDAAENPLEYATRMKGLVSDEEEGDESELREQGGGGGAIRDDDEDEGAKGLDV